MKKYKIILNPDIEHVQLTKRMIAKNDGHCPCKLIKSDETRCMCKEFREQDEEGMCSCGLYIKEARNENNS